jgi:tripeptidyl-peptidase-1
VHAKERNGDRVQAIALDVSDPSSTNYANYLSSDTLDALTAPAPEDVATIRNWLSTFGDDVDVDVTRGRTFRVTVPTTKAEQVLSTTFRQVSNANTLQSTVRAGDYTIPQVVKDATDTIMGLHGLPLPPRASRATSPKSPAAVTPAVILSQYDVSGVAAKASSGNIQAVAEFQGQTMSSKDLTQFFSKICAKCKTWR